MAKIDPQWPKVVDYCHLTGGRGRVLRGEGWRMPKRTLVTV